MRDGVPLDLGSRAFDLLHVLAKARGSLVSKDDILRQVWPTTLVEESNLRFQIAVLRKVLGRDRDIIKTVPGRGYHFAAESLGEVPQPAADAGGSILGLLDRAVHEASRPADGKRQAAQAGEAIEALRGLLQLALDELREMTAVSRDQHPCRATPLSEGRHGGLDLRLAGPAAG